MKKVVLIFLCLITSFSMSACKKGNVATLSENSSDAFVHETLVMPDSQANTSIIPDIDNTETSSIENNYTNSQDTSHIESNSNTQETSDTTQPTNDKGDSYKDIVCTKITDFQQVGFSTSDSNITVFVQIPKDWKLEKINGGYNIIKSSKYIGNVTTSKNVSSNETVNVFTSNININNINVTHNIDQIITEKNPSYTRTFCYNYNDENGNNKNIYITIPYQESDSSATYKMITEAKMLKTSTSTNLGLLQIQDNRKKILILGNSFIASSRIGTILQNMCGNEIYVEAHSRGYAHIDTYTNDAEIMQNIRDCNYSVVFICGLYNQESTNALQHMINVCNGSNTKLAVFPAHNEAQAKIDYAVTIYPDTIFLNWKAEINHLIETGIDVSNFCIPDAHNHSTPLAGYVGAHMIYRAIFNKIPQTIQFDEITKSQIELLGDYITTGKIILFDKISSYILE